VITDLKFAINPIEDFLTWILSDPVLLIACTIAFLALVAIGYTAYKMILEAVERSHAMNTTRLYISVLKKVAKTEGDSHGGESAQGLLDEFENRKEKMIGGEGIIHLKKFNMKVETFLAQRGYFPKEK
jgi:hypothetical protein